MSRRPIVQASRAKARLRPKRRLGQHFLTNTTILNALADAANVGPDDVVVEVGPGRGSLTGVLVTRARRVVAVEVDTQLAASLRGQFSANVEVHEADAREVAAEELLGGCVEYKLVGNLPYYAATPILRHFLEGTCKPSVAVVMVQLEVAREICAEPGKMSLLSVGIQLYGKPRLVRLVRPGSFIPPPKVTSAVVAIDVYKQPTESIEDSTGFFRVVRAGFSAPRKQLHNSLAQGLALPQAQAEQLLGQSGVEPSRRAETLSLEEWARLYRSWTSQR